MLEATLDGLLCYGGVKGAATLISEVTLFLQQVKDAAGTGNLFQETKSIGAAGNKLFNSLAKLGNQASGATGKQASSLLQRMANKAGLNVVSGGKHLKVLDSTGKVVTLIPHSPHAKGTINAIAQAIMKAAGF